MHYYVVSDGTEETAKKIREFLKSQNPNYGEIDRFEYRSTHNCYYWVDSSGVIQTKSFPPLGYIEHKIK